MRNAKQRNDLSILIPQSRDTSAIEMSFLKKTRRVHVTFGDYKRVINFPKDEEILDLRYHFHRGFSDVLSEDITPANVKFQRYDDAFQDYIDLENDAKLQENAKVKAIIPSKHGKKVYFSNCNLEIA